MPFDVGQEASKTLLKRGLYMNSQKQDAADAKPKPATAAQAATDSRSATGTGPSPRSSAAAGALRVSQTALGRRLTTGDEQLNRLPGPGTARAASPEAGAAGVLARPRLATDASLQQQQHQQQQQLQPAGRPPASQQQRESRSRDRLQLPSISAADQGAISNSSASDSKGRLALLGRHQPLQAQPLQLQPLQPFGRRVTQQLQPQVPKLPVLQAATTGSISNGPALLKPLQRPTLQQQQQQQHCNNQSDDDQSKERTAVWTGLLLSMLRNPEAQEFVYLKYARPEKAPLNSYDLQVCSHAEACKLPCHFTMSTAGVTSYLLDGSPAEFTTLEDFQREFVQHQQLLKLQLFKEFVRWKALSIWRKAVRLNKTTNSIERLQKGLYGLQPVLRQALRNVRDACLEFDGQQLSCLRLGQPLTLQAFAEQHAARLTEAKQCLQAVVAKVISTARTACEQCLAVLEQELMGASAAGKPAATARRSSTNSEVGERALSATPPRRGSVGLAAVEPVQLYTDSYALQAARRSEKRRLTGFIRLLDYMVADCVHSVVEASLQHMLHSLKGCVVVQPGTVNNAESEAEAQAPAPPASTASTPVQASSGASDIVVLQLEVLLDQQQDRLLLQPHAQDFLEGLATWLNGLAAMARDVPQLMQSLHLQPFIEAPVEPQHPNPEGLLPLMLGEDYERLSEALDSSLQQSLTAAEHCAAGFELFREMVVGNRQLISEGIQQAVQDGELGLDGLRGLLVAYQQQLADVDHIPSVMSVGVLKLELDQLKAALLPSPQRCLSELHTLLPQLAAGAYSSFMNRVSDYRKRLGQQPGSPEEFVTHMQLSAEVEAQRPAMDKQFDSVTAYYDLMEEFGVAAPEEDTTAARSMDVEYGALRDAAWAAESGKDRQAQIFLQLLEQRTAELAQDIAKVRLVEQQDMFLAESQDLEAIITAAAELMAQVKAHQATAEHISNLSVQCGGGPVVLSELEALSADVELKHLLWTVQQEWSRATSQWSTDQFLELDVLQMQDQVDQLARQVHRLERGLPPNSLVPKLRDSISQWQEILGPVAHLRNPQLRERHWNAVADLLGRQVDRTPEANTSINTLLDMQILHHKEQIAVISNEATQEASLEALLAQVADKWRGVEFEVKRFKDLKEVYILGEVDDILQVLEDSKITMSMIQASRYVGGIKPEVDRFDKQLRLFSDTLDAWLLVQKGWLALESVFAAPDIQRQVPVEAAAFAQVDKAFKDVMRRAHDRPNALQSGTTPGWLEVLTKCGETLEAVQKGLEDYLETKRVAFPRFYFLSNEELLDILRQAKVPQAVQPHLSKCFDGIFSLEFGQTGGEAAGPAHDILAMVSIEGERVAFGRTLKARGLIESWLSSVENNMRLTLKALAKKAFKDYTASRRPGWVLAQPAQLAILVSNIHWCQDVEVCLNELNANSQLQQLHARCVLQLEELTELIRGSLSDLERKSVVALITTDVHNRDIVSSLVEQGAAAVSDFSWQMQLRFEYDADTDSIMARQVNARFDYAYEYLGAQPRLVITPMTDRCYMTLTGALALRLGGAPSGPAGTGKTETVKDLGKALGVQCVVFNCGESLDYKFMAKFFRGLAQCGAWACFDEFNRINLEVLSVVAQQLLALQAALRAGAERLFFEGRDMALMPTVGVFITMNPGYAGRTELPDNLKVLFRPMAMMIPDYQLVAEVMLFSEGFDQATWLAVKMVQLYKLASEQLSQQDHYDFGMRALKAVLVMAGALKRSSPNVPEELVLIQAMRDANLPKLTSEDIILFEAILSDLFPNTQLPTPDQQQLTAALADSCKVLGLQPGDQFVNKATQLHDTLGVRFGVMLVGPAGGGKTSCYEALRLAQTGLVQANRATNSMNSARLSTSAMGSKNIMPSDQDHEQEPHQFKIHAQVINPKAISLSELYGSYSTVTHDWSDGLASSLVRRAVMSQTQDMHWVVFDGPVDAVWVENMNTVLDDNRMLCLPNGERIKLDEGRLRVMFEVEDLVHASPATVSRCGMVYMPSDIVGWRPYAFSWLNQLLAKQHAATNASPAVQPADIMDQQLAKEASRLPASSTSASGAAGNPHSSKTSAAGSCSSSLTGQKGTTVVQEDPQTAVLECPEELHGVRDFIWGLFEQFIDPLLAWVTESQATVLPVVEVSQLAAVTALFETQAANLRLSHWFDPALNERQKVLLQYLFAYAATWGIGGSLDSSCWDKWDKVVRAQFDGTANYPQGSGTVFDFFLDVSSDGSSVGFSPWETCVPSFSFNPAQPSHAIMVPTVDTCRYGTLLQACLAAGKPVLLVGGTGVGKSALVKDQATKLHRAMAGKLEHVELNCSARTGSREAQDLLEANLVKRGNRLGAPAGHQLLVFVDDINLPERQQYGAQPSLEMLRLLLDRHGLFERKSLVWKEVIDTTLVAACGPPGGGRQAMSSRLTRHILTLAMPAPSERVMRSICNAVLGGFLDVHFTPDVRSRLLRPLVESCVEVYSAASASLLPTPSKSHYTFNFRDVVKVLQGLLSIRPAQCGGNVSATLTRLWIHEVQRVFGDRLVCQGDRDWLQDLQQDLLISKFGWRLAPAAEAAEGVPPVGPARVVNVMQSMQFGGEGQVSESLFEGDEQVLFGDFMKIGLARQERVYEQLPSISKLAVLMERYLEEYNSSRGKSSSAAMAAASAAAAGGKGAGQSGSSSTAAAAAAAGSGSGCQLQLVFFQDAVIHIIRLARILRQPRGSALLVGVGGSGKQSLARFAALVADCDVFTVSVRRGYGISTFREEMKQLFKIAGVEGRHVMFLLTDSHIIDEAMLGDVNCLLNTGEITGLFALEEQALLLDQIRPWLSNLPDLAPGRRSAWQAFIGRVRHHLHVVFATSPVGEAFRVRCRQFPSLINCTSIDWFSPWPAEALLGVGVRFLEQLSLEQQPVSATPACTTPSPSAPSIGAAAPGAVAAGAVAAGKSVVHRVAELCVEVHKSVEAAAERFYQELKRRCYITPKLYLDLLQQYSLMLNNARTELGDNRRRLLNGIAKLAETNSALDSMQAQLNSLQPLLLEKTAATSALLKQVRAEQSEAEQVAAVVGAEETEVSAKAAECAALKAAAEAELAAVLPALEAAIAALDSLNKADIIEMKTFIKPPALVQLTMEGVCILLQEKTDWDAAKRVLSDANFINRLIEFDKDKISEKLRKELRRVVADPAFTPDQVGKQSKAAMSMCLWVRAMDTYATVYRIVEPKRQALAAAQAALDASNAVLAEKQAQLKATREKVAALQRQLADTQKELASLQFQADLCNKRLGRAGKLTSLLGDELVRWGEAADTLAERLQLVVGDAFMAAAIVNYLGAFTGPYRGELTAQWYSRCQELDVPITTPTFSLSGVLSTPVELLEWACQGLPSDAVSVENALIATRGHRWPLIIDPQEQANRWIRVKEAKAGLVVLKDSDPALLRQVENAVRLGQPLLIEQIGGGSLPSGLEPLLLKQIDKQAGRIVLRLGDHDVDYDAGFKLYMTTRLTNPHYLPETYIQVNLVNFTVTKEGLEEQLLAELVRAERPELEESRDSLITSISSDKRQLLELESKILRLLKESSGNLLDDETLISTLNSAKSTSGIIQSRVREAELTEVQINEARNEYCLPPIAAARLWFVISNLESLDGMYQASLAVFKSMYLHSIASAPSAPTLEGRLQALVAFMTSYVHRMVCRGLFDVHKLAFSFMIAAAIQRDLGEISSSEWDFLLIGSKAAVAAAVAGGGRSSSSSGSSSAAAGATSAASQPGEASTAVKPSWCAAAVWAGLQGLKATLPEAFGGLCSAVAAAPADNSSSDNSGDSWQQLLQPCSAVEDFVGSSGSTSLCLLDRLLSGAGVGAQQQLMLQQQQQQPGIISSMRSSSTRQQAVRLTKFQRLLLVKVCREELFVAAVQNYISTQLGPSFVEVPPMTFMDIYLDSGPYTPVIFLLSQGADAIADLARFAASEGRAVGKGLQVVSLGQGQGPVAEALVRLAMKSGDWVCLQNCHLAKSWMPQLAEMVRQLEEVARLRDTEQQLHPSFRLWLTTMPVDYFPGSVLQRGVRIALEPPRGLKPTLIRSYSALPSGCLSAFNSTGKSRQWQRLVFVAALLHGLVQERRRFGALGWNIPYEFSDSDLACALQNMQVILQEAVHSSSAYSSSRSGASADAGVDTSAWEALRYIVGQINYGGRVTDANDRRLLGVIMEQHLQPSVLGDSHRLTSTGTLLAAPIGDDVSSCISQIRGMPYSDDPLLFGLNPNASITLNRQEASKLTDCVLLMQPRMAAAVPAGSNAADLSKRPVSPPKRPKSSKRPQSAAAISPAAAATVSAEAAMLVRIADMLQQVPAALNRADASVLHDPFAALPGGGVNSLGMVLLQEIVRYNKLLSVVQCSLLDLQSALQGLQVMSRDAEATLQALTNHKVPPSWSAAAYPSNKPLASWLVDLAKRVDFMRHWLTTGQPAAFWLPGFFFPQGFLTGVLQHHARSTGTPINRLSFRFPVISSASGPADIAAPADVGVFVYGLYLESARWDKTAQCLVEAAPGEMFSQLPVVQLIPQDSEAPFVDKLIAAVAATSSSSSSSSSNGHHRGSIAAEAKARRLSQTSVGGAAVVAAAAGPLYACPLYKTPARAGVLSTTGHSTNFLVHMSLPICADATPQFWLLQGVALLCSLDD